LCPEGYGVDYHTFTCTGVPENPAEEKPNYAVIVSLWITGIVLLIILLIVMAYVYRVSATQKKDHVMEEMAERRAQIIVLQDQVHELEVEEEIVRSGSSRLRQSTSLL
jgi:nitric oxide reductase large subunit